MNNLYNDVRRFHEMFGHPRPDKPTYVEEALAERRARFMREEIFEFLEARTIVDQADAMIDLVYFAVGTLVCMGVQPEELWRIVHSANMAKGWPDGQPHRDPETGKTLKPPGWTAPEPLLLEEIERQSDA